jgi:hypothetical protein
MPKRKLRLTAQKPRKMAHHDDASSDKAAASRGLPKHLARLPREVLLLIYQYQPETRSRAKDAFLAILAGSGPECEEASLAALRRIQRLFSFQPREVWLVPRPRARTHFNSWTSPDEKGMRPQVFSVVPWLFRASELRWSLAVGGDGEEGTKHGDPVRDDADAPPDTQLPTRTRDLVCAEFALSMTRSARIADWIFSTFYRRGDPHCQIGVLDASSLHSDIFSILFLMYVRRGRLDMVQWLSTFPTVREAFCVPRAAPREAGDWKGSGRSCDAKGGSIVTAVNLVPSERATPAVSAPSLCMTFDAVGRALTAGPSPDEASDGWTRVSRADLVDALAACCGEMLTKSRPEGFSGLECAQWVQSHCAHGRALSDADVTVLLQELCEATDGETLAGPFPGSPLHCWLEWMCSSPSLRLSELATARRDLCRAFLRVEDAPAAFAWLHARAPLTRVEVVDDEHYDEALLWCALIEGKVTAAQWLHGQFQFTLEEARAVDHFIDACRRGDLAVARWLAETFSLERSVLKMAWISPKARLTPDQRAAQSWLSALLRRTPAGSRGRVLSAAQTRF